MATKHSWDFECPQFVDFCSGVESGPSDLWFAENSGGSIKGASSMTPSANLLRNKAPFQNYFSTPIQNLVHPCAFHPSNKTDSEKYRVKLVSKRFSKSDTSINAIGKPFVFKDEAANFPVFRPKRCVSVTDVTNKKYPTTPMCLKRTQFKQKSRKTTEELELEKIAELQKQTLNRIRSNEMALKRLKLKQKPPTVPKQLNKEEHVGQVATGRDPAVANIKSVHMKNSRLPPRGEKIHSKQINLFAPSERLKTVPPSADINKPAPPTGFWNKEHEFDFKPEERENADILPSMPPMVKYEGHSGLKFCTSYEKRTVFKPFNFHNRTKDFGSTSSLKCLQEGKENEKFNKPSLSNSMSTPQLKLKNKESTHNLSVFQVHGISARKLLENVKKF